MVKRDTMKEEIISLDQLSVTGILTYAEQSGNLPAVILFNAGLVHKTGPNRLYVKIARSLAAAGYTVFRFDQGGQGDSLVNTDLPGGQRDDYAVLIKILDLLIKKTGAGAFILGGLCSGAEKAYRLSFLDARIKGVIMINGSGLEPEYIDQVYPAASSAIRKRYYKKAMSEPSKWLKVLKGKSGVFRNMKISSFLHGGGRPQAEIENLPGKKVTSQGIQPREGISLLLVVAEGCTAYDLLGTVYGKDNKGISGTDYVFMPDTDHIISPVSSQLKLQEIVLTWLNRNFVQQLTSSSIYDSDQ